MSLGPIMESFFVAQTISGMDLSRGVPLKENAAVELNPKDGKTFEGILHEQNSARPQEQAAKADPALHKKVDEKSPLNEEVGDDSPVQEVESAENTDVSAEPSQEPENLDIEEEVDTEVALLSQQMIVTVAAAAASASVPVPAPAPAPAPQAPIEATKSEIDVTQESSILQAPQAPIALVAQVEKSVAPEEDSALDLKLDDSKQESDEPLATLEEPIDSPLAAKQVLESASPMKPEHLIAAIKAKGFGPAEKMQARDSDKQSSEDKNSENVLNVDDHLKIDILKYSEDKGLEQEPQMDLKQFSDRLWLQQKLGADVKLDGFTDELIKLEASNPTEPAIKNNLMDEMKPLLLKVIKTDSGGEMSMQLMPQHLGLLKIQIQSMDKGIKIQMQADNAAAHQALSAQVSELKSQLQKNGMEVHQVSISMIPGKNGMEMLKSQAGEQEQQKEQNHQQSSQGRDQNHDSRRGKEQKEFADEGWKEFFV